MKLQKKNILNGQTVKVSVADAFDEICANDFGLFEDWDIKCYSDFENAFKKDKEMEITCRDWTFENVPEEKKTHEDFILELKEGELTKYVDEVVKNAEWILMTVKDSQRRLNDKDYSRYTHKEDTVRSLMNDLQQINWHFDNGAQAIGDYAVAKTAKEFSKKEVSK